MLFDIYAGFDFVAHLFSALHTVAFILCYLVSLCPCTVDSYYALNCEM